MTITTPGVVPASVLVRDGQPEWLRDRARLAHLPQEAALSTAGLDGPLSTETTP